VNKDGGGSADVGVGVGVGVGDEGDGARDEVVARRLRRSPRSRCALMKCGSAERCGAERCCAGRCSASSAWRRHLGEGQGKMGSAASIPRCFKPTAALSADDSGEGTVGSAPRDDAVAGGRLAAPQRSGGRDEGLYQFYSILFLGPQRSC